MRAHVLGPLRLDRGQAHVAAPAGLVGLLLRHLLLEPNVVHSSERLIELLWPDVLEVDRGRRRLKVTVSRLRTFLRPETAAELGSLEVVHDGEGYRLIATADSLDRVAFETAAVDALDRVDPRAAARALALWQGEPYVGFPLSGVLRAQHARLAQLRRRLSDLQQGSVAPGERQLRAKVRPPRVVGKVIERSALLARVPNVGEVQVLSVSAPAGFGKSTFLEQWAARQTTPVGWLSLDAADNDPSRFWSGVMRSLTDLAGPGLAARAGDAAPGSAAFLEVLDDLIDPDRHGFGLVLDDLHLVAEGGVLAEVVRLVAALPPSSTIVLSSRADPPVARARLAAEGRLHAVTAGDLRFSVDEIKEATGCDDERAKRLWEVSEGWPVAATTLHRAGATLPARGPAVIEDYLAEEVFAPLDPDVLHVVLQLAHLDAFNADLCRVATGRADAGEVVADLRERGLFLVELEPTMGEGWCRLHHLIAAVALKRASFTVDSAEVWRRAARWSRANGLNEVALRYAIQARDRATVAATAGDVLLDSALRAEANTCVDLLRRIDPEDLRDEPRAHGVAVYLAMEWMPRDDRAAWLRSRRRHFGEGDVVLRLVRAIEATREGRTTAAIELAQEVLDQGAEYAAAHDAPDLAPVLLGSAFSNQMRARVLQGAMTHDDPLFASAVTQIRPHVPMLATWLHSYWGLVAVVDGQEPLAESLAEEFYQARRPRELSRPVRRDNSMLGALLASRQTADPERLTAIAEGIEDLPGMFDRGGQHTDAAIARLILASVHGRAGNRERHRHHTRGAAALLQTFEDAAFLPRLRDALDTLDGPGERTPAALAEGLTPRQRTIVAYLATDLSTKEIAEELHISLHTLRTHLRDVYRRLDVRSRHQAVMKVGAEQGGDLESARTAGH